MKAKIFARVDTWMGGDYELLIELGPVSDGRAWSALQALWSFPDLQGCYLRNDIEPDEQTRIDPDKVDPGLKTPPYGVAKIPTENQIACLSGVMRDENGCVWLFLCLPVGALSTVYDVGAYPHVDRKAIGSWLDSLDLWMVSIARSVFKQVSFDLALVGHDVFGRASTAQVAIEGIPSQRSDGYLWREAGELAWYAPNM